MGLNREGYPIIIGALAMVIILMLAALILVPVVGLPLWVLWILGVFFAGNLIFVMWFFRRPVRAYTTDPDIVFSAADGKVVVIEEVEQAEFIEGKFIQVSVFMSVWNVHMNWYPVGGKVVYSKHHPGCYLVAWHPKSSTCNEHTSIVVDTGKHRILFRQIAGMVARRIVNYAEVGDKVKQNTKFGFIKFGSRVDIFLPTDSEILVSLGDKVVGSQTPIAKLK